MTTAPRSAPLRHRTSTCSHLALPLLLLGAPAIGCGGSAPGDPVQVAGTVTPAQAQGPGGPTVRVYLNHPPILDRLAGEQTFVIDATGRVAMQASLVVTATDEDQDDLAFSWSAPGCPDAVLTVRSERGSEDEEDRAAAESRWRSRLELVAGADAACEVQVEVRDLWKGGQPPSGSGLPPERGAVATGSLELAPAPHLAGAPSP